MHVSSMYSRSQWSSPGGSFMLFYFCDDAASQQLEKVGVSLSRWLNPNVLSAFFLRVSSSTDAPDILSAGSTRWGCISPPTQAPRNKHTLFARSQRICLEPKASWLATAGVSLLGRRGWAQTVRDLSGLPAFPWRQQWWPAGKSVSTITVTNVGVFDDVSLMLTCVGIEQRSPTFFFAPWTSLMWDNIFTYQPLRCGGSIQQDKMMQSTKKVVFCKYNNKCESTVHLHVTLLAASSWQAPST